MFVDLPHNNTSICKVHNVSKLTESEARSVPQADCGCD